jgi:hypothetical protein
MKMQEIQETVDNYKIAINKMQTNLGPEFCADLAKAQAEMQGAVKDSQNPFFKSKYADMESVIESFREIFGKYGFSVLQPLSSKNSDQGTQWYVQTILAHKSGQVLIAEPVEIVIKEKNNPQAFGSSVTYFRRYTLASLLRIPQVDDDANEATRPNTQQRPQQQRPVQRTQFNGARQ